MTTSLPTIISAYFAAAEAGETTALVECFTEDAEVVDESETRHGHAGIRRWRDEVASKYEYELRVLDGHAADELQWTVSTRLEGNFPGGVADLDFRFALREGLISRLEIV